MVAAVEVAESVWIRLPSIDAVDRGAVAPVLIIPVTVTAADAWEFENECIVLPVMIGGTLVAVALLYIPIIDAVVVASIFPVAALKLLRVFPVITAWPRLLSIPLIRADVAVQELVI